MIYFTCDKPNSRSTGRRYTATLKWSNAHMPAGSTVAKLETTDRIRCTSSLHVVGVCAHSWDQQGECPNCAIGSSATGVLGGSTGGVCAVLRRSKGEGSATS